MKPREGEPHSEAEAEHWEKEIKDEGSSHALVLSAQTPHFSAMYGEQGHAPLALTLLLPPAAPSARAGPCAELHCLPVGTRGRAQPADADAFAYCSLIPKSLAGG